MLANVVWSKTEAQNLPQAVPNPSSVTSANCAFRGDQDTYGKGIRVGVYLQWMTSNLANNFVPDEAMTMRGVNTCFALANFAGETWMLYS